MRQTVESWGDTFGIQIPTEIAKAVDLTEGDQVIMKLLNEQQIVIELAPSVIGLEKDQIKNAVEEIRKFRPGDRRTRLDPEDLKGGED